MSVTGAAHRAEEEVLGKAYDARITRRLLRYLDPYRSRLVLAMALLVAASGVQILGPWLVQLALDQAVPAGDLPLLTLLVGAYFAAAAAAFVLQYLQAVLMAWLGQTSMLDLRRELFAKLQELDLAYYDRTPIGRLMTRVTSDVETLNELFSSGVVTILGDLLTLAFIVTAMFLMDPRLALVTLSIIPFVIWAAAIFRSRIRDAYRDIRVRVARINAFLHERITGIRVVQLFNREAADAAELDRANADYLQAHLRSIRLYALFFPVIEIFSAIAIALIVSYGGWAALSGETTVGVVTAFLLYARRFFRPIQDLSEQFNVLQAAMASSERIFQLLDHPTPLPPEEGERMSLPLPIRGEIEFRGVWFAYGERGEGEPDWVLRGLSFRASPGERIAIVGHTGAGKSTIIHLLMRFYEPQRGEILIDGIPIRRIPHRELRQAVGLVMQDVFLFSEELSYNIRLGEETISDEAVRRAAEEVGADRFIDRLPGRFGERLGERGVKLSVGERQLVSFARALAFNPPILVLDEATSSVDSELEARIGEATERVMAGRTSLVIAHRLSTIQGVDRILVLHQGQLREEGSHEELLAEDGLYARLYELQFAG